MSVHSREQIVRMDRERALSEGVSPSEWAEAVEETRRLDTVSALLHERAGVVAKGDDPERVTAIDVELERFGYQAEEPDPALAEEKPRRRNLGRAA